MTLKFLRSKLRCMIHHGYNFWGSHQKVSWCHTSTNITLNYPEVNRKFEGILPPVYKTRSLSLTAACYDKGNRFRLPLLINHYIDTRPPFLRVLGKEIFEWLMEGWASISRKFVILRMFPPSPFTVYGMYRSRSFRTAALLGVVDFTLPFFL